MRIHVDRWLEKYGEDLRKSKYPVVNLGTSAQPRYYPAEVCEVVDGQPYRKVLEGSQTADMIRVAARRPRENALSIVNEGLGTVGLVGSDNPILVRPPTGSRWNIFRSPPCLAACRSPMTPGPPGPPGPHSPHAV